MNRDLCRPSRFTLIELLVVIAIISVLAALLLPMLGRAKRQAQMVVCMGNLKQIGVGTLVYAGDYDEFYPSLGVLTERAHGSNIIGRNNSYNLEYHDNPGIEPLLAEVFTDSVRKIFSCPLARFPVQQSRWDTITNYSYWPDVNGRGAIKLTPDPDRSNMMMKVDQPYRYESRTHPRGIRESRIMAHDTCRVSIGTEGPWYGNRRILTNHFAYGAHYVKGEGYSGYYWVGAEKVALNYLQDDGSAFLRYGNPIVDPVYGATQIEGFSKTQGEWEASLQPNDLLRFK